MCVLFIYFNYNTYFVVDTILKIQYQALVDGLHNLILPSFLLKQILRRLGASGLIENQCTFYMDKSKIFLKIATVLLG